MRYKYELVDAWSLRCLRCGEVPTFTSARDIVRWINKHNWLHRWWALRDAFELPIVAGVET